MPFSKVPRRVACLLQKSWEQRGFRIEPIGHVTFRIAWYPREMTVDVVSGWKMSRHDRRSAGRAYTARHGESVEVGAFACQTINVGRLDVGVPVTAQVTPAPVIGKDE